MEASTRNQSARARVSVERLRQWRNGPLVASSGAEVETRGLSGRTAVGGVHPGETNVMGKTATMVAGRDDSDSDCAQPKLHGNMIIQGAARTRRASFLGTPKIGTDSQDL
jgi:hypothetical protein